MNGSKRRASVVAAVVLGALVVGVGGAVTHQKATKFWVSRDVGRRKARLADLKRHLSNCEKWREDYQDLSLKLGARLQNCTWNDQMPFMVTQLTGIVEARGLKIETLQPEQMTSGEHILRFPLRIGLNCDLSDVTRILRDIESTTPLLDIERLDIRTNPDESGKLQVGMTVSSFVVRDERAPQTKRRSSALDNPNSAGNPKSEEGST